MADNKGPLLISIVPPPSGKKSGGFSLLAFGKVLFWFLLICGVLKLWSMIFT